MNIILIGTAASFIAGAVTVAGAALVFFLKKVSDKFIDTAMGFSAGVMLSATFFGLIAPAIKMGGVAKASVGILAGMLFLIFMEKAVPHMHRVAGIKGPPVKLSRMALFILAMTIHNFPEGLSVGVGFGSGDFSTGLLLAAGIGMQNLIEGLATAVSLFRDKNMIWRAFLIASFTCVVEPIGGLFGVSVVTFAKALIPYGLAFAAGAMLFVTSGEIIPETHSRGNAREATVGLILGFIVMMILESMFQ